MIKLKSGGKWTFKFSAEKTKAIFFAINNLTGHSDLYSILFMTGKLTTDIFDQRREAETSEHILMSAKKLTHEISAVHVISDGLKAAPAVWSMRTAPTVYSRGYPVLKV